MATQREREILNMIRHNPMISQKELAEKLGITRPGVASHISHLIKEGLSAQVRRFYPARFCAVTRPSAKTASSDPIL